MSKDTLAAKITPQQKEVFTEARGEITQSEAVRLALKEWVERRGYKWPEFVFDKHGGDRRSQDFRNRTLGGNNENTP